VNRIRQLHPALVVRVAALRREFLVLRAVKFRERLHRRIARDELRLLHQRREKPPPHDLETLVLIRRTPR